MGPRPDDDDAFRGRELTARPTVDRGTGGLFDEDGEKLVPSTNVGGAAPTELGRDSGGDLPGSKELANLAEPEPPRPAEVKAMHVRRRRREE